MASNNLWKKGNRKRIIDTRVLQINSKTRNLFRRADEIEVFLRDVVFHGDFIEGLKETFSQEHEGIESKTHRFGRN